MRVPRRNIDGKGGYLLNQDWMFVSKAVQRRFTPLISDIGLKPYSDRLLSLQLTTLAERRMRGDLIETFK